jgi:hypothetical protein
MALGLSDTLTVLFIYLLSASLELGALAMTRLDTTHNLLLLVQGGLTLMIIAVLMMKGATLLNEEDR